MALKDQLYIEGIWTDSAVRGSNYTGTPIVSAVLNNTGELISDNYTLTVSGRAGGTGTVTVSNTSANNPYLGKIITGVTMDSATGITNIIPGTTIVFSSSAVNGDVAEVIVGFPYGSFDATGVSAGVPTAGVQHRIENTGDAAVADAKASLYTQAVLYKKTGTVFQYVSPFAGDAVEKLAGGGSSRIMPYAISISDIAGSGGSKTCTVSVDGVAFTAAQLLDLVGGTTQDGTLVKALGTTNPYKVIDGPLSGLTFAISASCANGDVANVLIFPTRYVQIALDVSGVEGTYGTVDVLLTTSGQLDGVILASDVAYYWVRFLVPESANNESNPYPVNIAIQSSQSTAAGWDE